MSLNLRAVGIPGRLAGIDLELPPGQVLAVVGRNGAGKSTLLAAALGLLPCQGEVLADGRPVASLTPLQRAEQLAWLPQEPAPTDGLSALEVVEAARYRFSESRHEARAAAQDALVGLGMADFASRAMHTLSGGERQRVRMAALVAQQARYWLLDEPGNHLDPAAQIDAWARLGDAARDGRGILAVTHDVTLLAALGDVPVTVLGLAAGAAAFSMDASDPTLPDALGGLLELRFARVRLEGRDHLVVAGRA